MVISLTLMSALPYAYASYACTPLMGALWAVNGHIPNLGASPALLLSQFREGLEEQGKDQGWTQG